MGRDKPAVGDTASLEVSVTEEMLVDLGGRRIHPLYATAWMVRHMEEAGRLLIEPHLRPGEDATGYSISVTHEAPARVGDRLTVTATATRVDERETETVVEVTGPGGRIGRGTLIQRYVPAGMFEED
ncbi:MAG TPA: hotdog domain-containing protein [Actinomycetota bacterium]|nr:hotdog domain-containing protein [Actinomycetota bacterium]